MSFLFQFESAVSKNTNTCAVEEKPKKKDKAKAKKLAKKNASKDAFSSFITALTKKSDSSENVPVVHEGNSTTITETMPVTTFYQKVNDDNTLGEPIPIIGEGTAVTVITHEEVENSSVVPEASSAPTAEAAENPMAKAFARANERRLNQPQHAHAAVKTKKATKAS